MNEHTRFARVESLGREHDNDVTRVGRPLASPWLDLRTTFNLLQRQLAATIAAQPRVGLFVFALNAHGRCSGHLWLKADEGVRAGIIGRHSNADLSLAAESAMSLRHCVVVVTRDARGRLHTWVSDLDSEAGLQSETHERVSAVESDGPFLLQIPGGALLFVPTGWGLPWRVDAEDPFDTLPRRCTVTGAAPPRIPLAHTSMHFHEGPASKRAPRETLLQGEAPLGQVEVTAIGRHVVAPVGMAALERGLLFGRYDRCVGAKVCDGSVSRVHALLVARGGQLVMLDTGSTNGLFRAGLVVRCEPVVPSAWYELADGAMVRWTPRAPGNG